MKNAGVFLKARMAEGPVQNCLWPFVYMSMFCRKNLGASGSVTSPFRKQSATSVKLGSAQRAAEIYHESRSPERQKKGETPTLRKEIDTDTYTSRTRRKSKHQ